MNAPDLVLISNTTNGSTARATSLRSRHLESNQWPQQTFFSVLTLAMNLPICLQAGFGQSFDEIVTVDIIQKDILALVSAAHDVVDRTGILNAEFARHGGRMLLRAKLCQDSSTGISTV
jgi:hypothetical protein